MCCCALIVVGFCWLVGVVDCVPFRRLLCIAMFVLRLVCFCCLVFVAWCCAACVVYWLLWGECCPLFVVLWLMCVGFAMCVAGCVLCRACGVVFVDCCALIGECCCVLVFLLHCSALLWSFVVVCR